MKNIIVILSNIEKKAKSNSILFMMTLETHLRLFKCAQIAYSYLCICKLVLKEVHFVVLDENLLNIFIGYKNENRC